MKVVVAGATGETGRRVVRSLVKRGIETRAMVRDRAQALTILPPEAEVVVGDVGDRASLAAAIAGCTMLICATGARPDLDPTGPYRVDFEGTKNLMAIAQDHNIEHFVLVSSLCVSRFFHPLNLFWLVLYWKQQAEKALQSSGLTYTIVRPGGLRSEDRDTPVVMAGADQLFEGSIPRSQVAECCVEALFDPAARNKILEIVARDEVPATPWSELFAAV
jgi:uncharacterized protein YbjT (DUF2867 family)